MFRKKKGQLGASNSGSTFSLNKSGKSFFEKLFNKSSKSKSQSNINQIGLSVNDGFNGRNIDTNVQKRTPSRNDVTENYEVYGKYAQVQRKKQRAAEKYFSKRQLSIENDELDVPQVSMITGGNNISITNGAYNLDSIQRNVNIEKQTQNHVDIPPPSELTTQQKSNIQYNDQLRYNTSSEAAKQTNFQNQNEKTERKSQTKELQQELEPHFPTYKQQEKPEAYATNHQQENPENYGINNQQKESENYAANKQLKEPETYANNNQQEKPKDSSNSIEQLMLIAQQAQQKRESDQQKQQQDSKPEVKSLRQMRKAVTTGSPYNRVSSNTANTLPFAPTSNIIPTDNKVPINTANVSLNTAYTNVHEISNNASSIVETPLSIDKPVVENVNTVEVIGRDENNKDALEENLSEQIKHININTENEQTTSEHVETREIKNRDQTIDQPLTHNPPHFEPATINLSPTKPSPINFSSTKPPPEDLAPIIISSQKMAPSKPPRMSPEGATNPNTIFTDDNDENYQIKTIESTNITLDNRDGYPFYNSGMVGNDIDVKYNGVDRAIKTKHQVKHINDYKDDDNEEFDRPKIIDKNKNVSKIVIKNNEIIINNENKILNHTKNRDSFMPTSNNIFDNCTNLSNDVTVKDDFEESIMEVKGRSYNEGKGDRCYNEVEEKGRGYEVSKTITMSFTDEVRDSGFGGDMVTNIDDEINEDEQRSSLNLNTEEDNSLEKRDIMMQSKLQYEIEEQDTLRTKRSSFKPGRFSLNVGSQENHTREEAKEDHEYFRRKQKSEITSKRGSMRGVKDAVKSGVNAFVNYKEQSTLKKLQKKSRGRVTLFTTSMGVIRRTYDHCMHVKKILQNHRVYFIEKDVYISEENSEELMNRFRMQKLLSNDERDSRQSKLGSGDPFTRLEYEEMLTKLPRVFVEDLDLGGYTEVMNLNETDVLKKIFQDFKKVEGDITCAGCGGFNYTPCSTCHGSKKIWRSRSNGDDDKKDVYIGNKYHSSFNEEMMICLKCTRCDSNGLVRCGVCDVEEEEVVEVVRISTNTHHNNNINNGGGTQIEENKVPNGDWIVEEVTEGNAINPKNFSDKQIHDDLNIKNGWDQKEQPYIEYETNDVFDIEFKLPTKRDCTVFNLNSSMKPEVTSRRAEGVGTYLNRGMINRNGDVSDSEA